MGKKGNWVSALRRVFVSTSKDKPAIAGPDREFVKEKKKWAIAKLKNGGTKAFFLLHREPSSIEDILGDAEREHHSPTLPPEPPKNAQIQSYAGRPTIDAEASKRANQSSDAGSRVAVSERGRLPRQGKNSPGRPTPKDRAAAAATSPPAITEKDAQKSAATKIQAAYRGYRVRKKYLALKGLLRLQSMVRGQRVKRQTENALKLMQVCTRAQSQIRMARIQAMENQTARRRAPPHLGEKALEAAGGGGGRWGSILNRKREADEQSHELWDCSLLTKEEMGARMQRKVAAVVKRERALAYATSRQQQLPEARQKSLRPAAAGQRSGGGPVWWAWLERHFQSAHHPPGRPPTPPTKASAGRWNTAAAPDRRPRQGRRRQGKLSGSVQEEAEAWTPRSSNSAVKANGLLSSLNKGGINVPPPSRAGGGRAPPPRDDESLTSCPAYTTPGYMAPTLSAAAKVREQAFLRELEPAAAAAKKKRFSFGLSQSIGALRWGRSSLFAPPEKETSTGRRRGRHRSAQSLGNLSVDSVASQPAGVARKAFM